MDIKQQTKNVAAQGRFGDSMLLHVNPEEVKGLASAMPITINPETGQPEAFLPFLAPMLGSLLAPSVLGAMGVTGLSAGAMAGIGAGLATYAQTGGSGSKALLSGLTAGLGTKALSGGAEAAVGADAATQAATTGGDIAAQTAAKDAAITAAQEGSKLGFNAAGDFRGFTPRESFRTMFGERGLDAGMKSLAGAAMEPTGMLAATAAGTGAVMQSQEEFERMLAQMDIDDEERKRLMYERYPEQIPVASGGKIGFQRGRNIFYDPREDIDFDIGFNPNLGNNLTGQYQLPPRRTPRPIPRGFMPGFQPEFSYFESINPTATDLGFGQTQGFNSFAPPRRGGFGGLFGQRRRPIGGGNIAFPGGSPNFNFRGPRFGRPPMFAGYGNPFMQSPTYQGFYGTPQMQQMLNPYARFVQQPMPFPGFGFYGRPTPPPFIGGPGPGPVPQPDPVPDPTPPVADPVPTPPITGPTPPQKGGPTPVEPIQPPDDFVRPRPIDRPEPIRPIDRPRPRPRPPITGPIRPEPIDIIGRPPIDRPLPPGFNPIKLPIDRPIRPPSIGGPGGGNFIPEPEPVAPPPSITIPIEGGADVTIPDFSRPKPEPMPFETNRLTDIMLPPQDMMARLAEPTYTTGTSELMDRMFPSGRPGPIAPPNMPVDRGPRPINVQPQLPQTGGIPVTGGGPLGSGILPEANLPAGTPTQSGPAPGARQIPTGPTMGSITAAPTTRRIPPGPAMGGIFGAPMFEDGGDTNVEVDKLPEGLKAMYDSGPKGREGVEKIAAKTDKFQEGGPTDMMQDPIVQETIQFILGETDDSNIVNEFILKYGQEQFMILRNMILTQAAGNPNVQTEGLIQGTGRSGMADDLPMNIGDKPIAAVSQDEYIIPADVVSMLGDGSSDAGSKQLDGMLDRIRMAKTGGTTQAKRINPSKVLPA